MKPIYLFHDEGISKRDLRDAACAILDGARMFNNRESKMLGSMPRLGRTRSSTDDMIKRSELIRVSTYGDQRNANQIWDKIFSTDRRREEDFVFVFLVSCDLTVRQITGDYLNYCFGVTRMKGTVISVARLRDLTDKERSLAIKGLVMHELGHIFGVAADPSRENTEEKIGMHCTDRSCVMHQGMNLKELMSNFKRADNAGRRAGDWTRRYYCPLCLADAVRDRDF